MKLFIAQFNPVVGDIAGNAKKILDISGNAYKDSADLVLTPELSLWGYPPKDLLFKKHLINLIWSFFYNHLREYLISFF